MKIFKCTKCGSTKLLLKHATEEVKQPTAVDKIVFAVIGICTLGLFFVFHHFAEVKKQDLGTDYYECENCHFKINAKQADFDIMPEVKEEELDEEDKEAIREIGRKPVDMATWKKEREEAVAKRREKKEEEIKKIKKTSKKSKKTSKK